MENWFNYISVTVLIIGLFWLQLSDSRRSIIIAYCVVVFMVFSINFQFWTFGFALSKLITAIMAIVLMALAPDPGQQLESRGNRTGRVFRGLGLAFCLLLVIFTLHKSTAYLSLSVDQTLPSLAILFCGFLMLGVSREPFKIIVGLLTILVGFEILYGAIEQSILVNGLLAAVFLLIAVVGSYLITPAQVEDDQ